MATTETLTSGARRRHVRPAQGGPAAAHGQRPSSSTTSTCRAQLWLDGRAQPVRARDDRGVDCRGPRAAPGVLAAFSGADLAADWAGSLPCAWPVTEDIKMPPHWPLAVRQGAPRRRRRRGRRRRDARAREGCGGARRGRVRAAAGRRRTSSRRSRTSAARPRRVRHERVLPGSSRPARSTRRSRTPTSPSSERYRQQRLIPNAMEPRGVLAQRDAGHRRADALVVDADPAHPAADARGRRSGSPRRSCAWSRPTSAAASARSSTSTRRRRSPRARPPAGGR